MAWGWNAYWKIMPMVAGRYLMRNDQHDQAAARKIAAMMGTTFSVTESQTLHPAQEDEPQMTTSTTPTIQPGTPKAVEKVEPMELDWTMQPMKPRARMMATAKKPARNLPKPP